MANRKFKKKKEWTNDELESGISNGNNNDVEKVLETSDNVIEFFDEVMNSKNLPFNISCAFVTIPKQKQMVKIKKISDDYKLLLKKDIIFSFNEEIFMSMDDISKKILLEQEIDKIVLNMDSGAIKIVKPDLITFSGLIRKYGIEPIVKANSSESLLVQQIEDNNTN